MATRKPKAEGIAAILEKPDQVSIQELTMLDFFAAFASMNWPQRSHKDSAKEIWDRAEAMMNEREQRL